MALVLLTESIDEGLCGHVALEAPNREAALSYIVRHWDHLKGAFGGSFKDLDAHLRSYCEGRAVQVQDLSSSDLEAVLKRTHIDGDSEAGYELTALSPIDTTQGPPSPLRKAVAAAIRHPPSTTSETEWSRPSAAVTRGIP